MKVTIALADDHILIRNGMAVLLQKLGYEVIFEADNGIDFLGKLERHPLPDIVLMDINMPQMDGYETTLRLRKLHPEIKVLALTMFDNENSVLRMIRSGAKGYILKDSHPSELKKAIQSVYLKGYYQSDIVTGKLIHSINRLDDLEHADVKENFPLTQREIEFLKLVCTELTYKEIAEKMYVSPRTVDGYRDELFQKLQLKSRVGLVIFAIRNNLYTV